MEWLKCCVDTLRDTDYNKCISLMTKERKEKINTITHPAARRASVFGEWIVKKYISQTFGIPVTDIILLRDDCGKPYAKDIPIHFNISHCQNLVVAAFDTKPIGIDIEKLRNIDLKIAKRVCTDKDNEYLFNGNPVSALPDNEQILRFFKIWTAKEAYFKKIGTGITNLKSISYCDLSPLHFYEDGCVITII